MKSRSSSETSPTRRFRLLLIAAVILLGGVLAFLGAPTFSGSEKQIDLSYSTTADTTPVRLIIGDRTFAIPKNYIWSREHWKDGKVEGVNLHALLPDFEGYTQANRHEFERGGWNRKVTVMVAEHSTERRPASMTRSQIFARLAKGARREEAGPHGLKKITVEGRSPRDNEIYAGTMPDRSMYWVMCAPDGKVKFPSCNTDVEYSPNVFVRYTFAKRHLADWQTIEQRVFELIRRFDSSQPAKTK